MNVWIVGVLVVVFTLLVVLFLPRGKCLFDVKCDGVYTHQKECTCALKEEHIKKNKFLANLLGKTYKVNNRKVTIKPDGEVLTEDNPDNKCFKDYIQNEVDGMYPLGASAHMDAKDGSVYIFDGVSGKQIKAREIKGHVPRTDCEPIAQF